MSATKSADKSYKHELTNATRVWEKCSDESAIMKPYGRQFKV